MKTKEIIEDLTYCVQGVFCFLIVVCLFVGLWTMIDFVIKIFFSEFSLSYLAFCPKL